MAIGDRVKFWTKIDTLELNRTLHDLGAVVIGVNEWGVATVLVEKKAEAEKRLAGRIVRTSFAPPYPWKRQPTHS